MLRDVWVRVPPGAPKTFSYAPIVYRLGHKVLILGRAVRLRLGVPIRKTTILGPHRLSARTQGSHPWKSGPTPLGGAIRRGGRAWLNAHDSKSCVPQGTGGSNPSLSASSNVNQDMALRHVFLLSKGRVSTKTQGAACAAPGEWKRLCGATGKGPSKH